MGCCDHVINIYELCEKCAKEFLNTPDFPTVDTTVPIKCECGSEKTGGPGHSDWCPKSEEGHGTD